MHEMGMCEGVLAAVEQRARGRPVERIGVIAGTLLRVEPEAFQASFELVAAGTVAADATTEVTIAPIQARCAACDVDFDTLDPFPACPDCGGVNLQREGGEQLVLEWVRYAAETEAPPGDDPVVHQSRATAR
jgi:hydrogenase nickel incorporation protein HypA/HybF